jgi:hypothetical protein
LLRSKELEQVDGFIYPNLIIVTCERGETIPVKRARRQSHEQEIWSRSSRRAVYFTRNLIRRSLGSTNENYHPQKSGCIIQKLQPR